MTRKFQFLSKLSKKVSKASTKLFIRTNFFINLKNNGFNHSNVWTAEFFTQHFNSLELNFITQNYSKTFFRRSHSISLQNQNRESIIRNLSVSTLLLLLFQNLTSN